METNDKIKHLINRFNEVCNISVKRIAAIWKKVGLEPELGLNVHLRIEIQIYRVHCTYWLWSGIGGGQLRAYIFTGEWY